MHSFSMEQAIAGCRGPFRSFTRITRVGLIAETGGGLFGVRVFGG